MWGVVRNENQACIKHSSSAKSCANTTIKKKLQGILAVGGIKPILLGSVHVVDDSQTAVAAMSNK